MGFSSFFASAVSLCWLICFLLALVLFLSGFIYLLRKHAIREEHLATASVFEFAAGALLYLPWELFNDDTLSRIPLLKILESILTAILRTFNIYLGGGYVEVTFEDSPVFTVLYSALMAATNIAMLLFVAGFLIKFLDGPLQKLRLAFRRKRHIYLFPDCNEKTISIAESIEDPMGLPVFICVASDLSADEKDAIEKIKGIYVCGVLEHLLPKLLKRADRTEIFLFGAKEADNLENLSRLCELVKKFPDKVTRIYVELFDTPWSLYDDFLKKNNSSDGNHLVVNFVRTEESFAYNHLLKHSIFADARPLSDSPMARRKIGFVLVGMNKRNLELLKASLHLSQMPGYLPVFLILDENPLGMDLLEEEIPEIHKNTLEGDALYDLHYFEGVDFASAKMEEALDMVLPDFTFAFVNAGDDLLNLNLAIRLQSYRLRKGETEGYSIQINILRQNACTHWSRDLTERFSMVGDLKSTYDYRFITMSDIEQATIAIHNVRYPQDKEGSPTWISYCNNEYNRHSVYARTLSFRYKVWIIDTFFGGDYSITSSSRIWKIYEHMRWNVYTRTLGYVLADEKALAPDGTLNKKTRNVAMIHNDLIPFEQLSKEEQDKDALALTPEVVQILKNM